MRKGMNAMTRIEAIENHVLVQELKLNNLNTIVNKWLTVNSATRVDIPRENTTFGSVRDILQEYRNQIVLDLNQKKLNKKVDEKATMASVSIFEETSNPDELTDMELLQWNNCTFVRQMYWQAKPRR